MKRWVGCMLILVQLACAVLSMPMQVLAEETDITLLAIDCSETNIPEAQRYQSIDRQYGFGVSTDEYILFSIHVPVSGTYQLSARVGADGDAFSFWVDEHFVTKQFVSTGGFNIMTEQAFTTLTLKEGTHTIKGGVQGIPQTGCQFYSLTLSRQGDIAEEAVTVVEVESFSAVYDTTPSTAMDEWCDAYEVYPTDGFMLVLDTEWMVYRPYFAKGGGYALYCNQKVERDNLRLRFTVDGEVRETAVPSKDTTHFTDYFVGYFDLSAGVHEIKVEMLSGDGFLFDKMEFVRCFEPVPDVMEIEPQAYTEQEGTNLSSFLKIPETGWAEYSITAHYAGYYRLCAEFAANSTGIINVYVNREHAARLTAENMAASSYAAVGYVYLQKGANKLRLTSMYGSPALCALTLTALPNAEPQGLAALVRQMNEARSSAEAERAADGFFSVLEEDKEEWLENIAYPEPIFADLLQRNFSDFAEVMQVWYTSAQREKQAPRIVLQNQNGKALLKPETGNLTIRICSERCEGTFEIIAALYQNDRIRAVASAPCEGAAETTLSLGFVNINPQQEAYLRLFYWDSLSSMHPVEPHRSVYRTIHLSPGGSNETGDGSRENPYGSIAKAKEVIGSLRQHMTGDIVISLAGGEYFLPETQYLTENSGGANGYKVIWRGEDSQNPPVLSGGVRIADWHAEDGGLWSAAVQTDAMRSLYINGKAARRAVNQYFYEAEDAFKTENSPYAADGFIIKKSRFPQFAAPEELELVWNLEWTCQRLPVADIKEQGDSWLVYMKQPYYHNALAKEYDLTTPSYKKPFYVENAREFLDEPGEFYFSKAEGKVYYYPFEGENPNQCEVYYPKTEQLFIVKGENELLRDCDFDTITFRYGAYNGATQGGVVGFQADKIVSGANDTIESVGAVIPSQFVIENANNITIQNCRFESLGSGAVSMMEGVSDVSLRGNVICDTAGTGIIVGSWDHDTGYSSERLCKNIEITNNVLVRNSYEYRGGTAISVYYADGVDITHNNISQTPYSGITIGWGWGLAAERFGNINILYNRIEDVMYSLQDGGHIYTLGAMKHALIRGNDLKTSHHSYYGGLYCDSGSSDIEVSGNAVSGSYLWFMQGVHQTRSLNVHDNFADLPHFVTFDTENGNRILQATQTGEQPLGYEAIIRNAAGVLPAYKHLLQGLEAPAAWIHMLQTDKVRYADGQLIEAEDFMEGGEGIGYHKVVQGNKNGIYRPEGVDIYESPRRGNYCVGNTMDGDWLQYKFEAQSDGVYHIAMRTAAVDDNVRVDLYMDGVKIAEGIAVPKRESWEAYVTVPLASGALYSGVHEFRVVFQKGGCSLDYFTITKD